MKTTQFHPGTARFFALVISFSMLTGLSGCGMRSIPLAENDVEAAWAEVINQYKRRADLVPNLVEVVKGYAKHERETLEAVIAARSRATQVTVDASKGLNAQALQQFQKSQGELSGALSRLLVVAENYPQLKANDNFRDLQAQLEGTENRITVARQRYIESVNRFNGLVSAPPESWYNSMFLKKEKKPQFTVDNVNEVKEPPKVTF